MKKYALFFVCLCCSWSLQAQVGIGTTTPSAMLDIKASDQVNPANTDGLLIPKIDEFPSVVPTAASDGMLVFASGLGSVSKGFYYWNSLTGSWVDLSGGIAQWTASGADIERQSGNVYIGNTNSTNNDLYISDRIIDWDNSGYFLDPGSVSVMNELQLDEGSEGDPSIYFNTADSGFFSGADDEISYTANGTEAVRFEADGRVSFLDTTEANGTPGTGVIEIGGTLRLDGNEIITNDNVTLFLQNNNNADVRIDNSTLVVDASEDFVGIGLVNPHFTLDVDGPVMLQDTSTPTPLSGHSGIYSNFGELFAIDQSGNSTVISPHRFSLIDASDPMAWSFYSRNETIGQQINVDMFKVVSLVEQLTGVVLIHKADLDGDPISLANPSAKSTVEKINKLEAENSALKLQLEAQEIRLRRIERLLER